MKAFNFKSRLAGIISAALPFIANLAPLALPAQAQPQHLQDAVTLVTQIRGQAELGTFTDTNGVALNRYGGDWEDDDEPSFIQFAAPGVSAANFTTCAPFVTHLLKEAYGWDWSDYSWFDPAEGEFTESESPSSWKYVAYIKGHVGFTNHVTRLDEVQPGDIAAAQDVGLTTGHTMIVAGVDLGSAKAYLSGLPDSNTNYAGTTYYEVTVIDSSKSVHTGDTRCFYNTNQVLVAQTEGVGIGKIGVLVNQNMEVVAHTWSLPTSGKHNGTASERNKWVKSLNSRIRDQFASGGRELVFGRLDLVP